MRNHYCDRARETRDVHLVNGIGYVGDNDVCNECCSSAHDTEAKAGSLRQCDTETPQVGTWQWDISGRRFCRRSAVVRRPAVSMPAKGPITLESWARRIHPDDVGEFRRRFEAVRLGKVDRFELEYRVLVGETRLDLAAAAGPRR